LPAEACIVTSVSWDHEAILGSSLPAILTEKLGIARPGVPLFTGLHEPELVAQARQQCAVVGAPLLVLAPDAARVIRLDPYEGMHFELADVALPLRCRFLGDHHARHAALAAAAVRYLLHDSPASLPAIASGMAEAFLAGRFQVLQAVGRVPETVIDVAHNQQSLHATLDLAQRFFAGRRPTIVLGMLRDKRIDGVLQRLPGWAARLILTAPQVERAWDLETARQQAVAVLDGLPVEVVPQVASAVRQTQDGANDLVLVLGSHYLVGEALPVLATVRGMQPQALVRLPQRVTLGRT
jgi:dihydrofolate synthase/folylpolyglutamate synthase